MSPTVDYRATVFARARRDPEFREGMLMEGVQCLLAGEIDVATIVLRDYIETTISYEKLGELTSAPPETLACMFGKKGNPIAADLLSVVSTIQRHEEICLEVHVVRQGVGQIYEADHEENHKPAPRPA